MLKSPVQTVKIATDKNDKVIINFAWHKLLSFLSSLYMINWISQTWWWGGISSGVATPRHPQACAHVKFTGAQVKVMWKAKVKDQAWSQVSCGREASIQERLNEWYLWPKTASQVISEWERAPPSRCVLHTHWVYPCCAHVTCSSGYATRDERLTINFDLNVWTLYFLCVW